MTKYKVGDRVKCIRVWSTAERMFGEYIGHYATISKQGVRSGIFRIEFDDKLNSQYTWNFYQKGLNDYFELCNEGIQLEFNFMKD